MVLSEGQFYTRECLATSRDIFGCHMGECYWCLVIGAMDTAEYQRIHMAAHPTTKKQPIQNVSSAELEKPCYRETVL